MRLPSQQQQILLRWAPQRIMKAVWKKIVPGLFIICWGIVLSAPFGIPGQIELQSGIILGTVWFWVLYRPQVMSLPLLFLSGLIVELFVVTPPGFLLLWMLVVYGVAQGVRFRLAQGGFFRSWGVYALTVLGGVFLEWCLMSIQAVAIISPFAMVFQWVLTIGVYPLLHAGFAWGRRIFDNS
ncbi:hypothetical protein GS501_03030 [Saccharibacter sp. 17.LH.SD]|uniref:hypothetical protein n=1 Tax=Saccharibacter sp. 17.LH.SD TaxID=2689393 RepID=UPI00136B321A|nr:hypothetical protein [Saccharibacter sp. 17.LH.SD]MXV44027.1 hypothetical protein [Saccharibacter sp. 17.LH.SD]